MKRQSAQSGVVRIGKAVDDGVEGVTADCFVFVFCGGVCLLVLARGIRSSDQNLLAASMNDA